MEMKQTMTRSMAKAMYEVLTNLPVGHLESEDLGKVMDNIAALSIPYEQLVKLLKELGKRLFEGKDEKEIDTFNKMLTLASKADDIAKVAAIHKSLEAEHPELYGLFKKQNEVRRTLLSKEVEVELYEVDKQTFIKAVLKGNPDVPVAEFDLFDTMFTKEAKEAKAENFSELDELLKQTT